jgi:[protein-PII] uridylyltransferase
MCSYFLVAKDVGDLTRIFCAALEEQHQKPAPSLTRLLPGFLKPRTEGDAFYAENGRLRARKGLFREDPVNLIRLFQIADVKEVDIHPRTLRTVTRSLHLIDDDLRTNPEANRLFLDVLTSRHDPETALRRMNEAGVMGKFMPEFGRVVALMQFNMYHHYTVDEHLLFAVGTCARIERGELKKEHPLASELIKRVRSRDVLYITMLLHDMAKGLPGDHSELGAMLAESLCPRLGLSDADTATVAWLVRHHLLMSDMAQKRDVSDPKTAKDFASTVQTPERLRLLLIVTVADIRAVGPGVWNDWKGQLLRELYAETETLMTGGDSSPERSLRIKSAKRELLERISDLSQVAREQSVARHYDSYWLAFDTDAYEFHARLVAQAEASEEQLALGTRIDALPGITEFVLYTGDHPGLFARLAGAFSLSGYSIVAAKIFTTSDGHALDVFRVRDLGAGAFVDQGRIERLRQTILKTLAGKILPHSILAERVPGKRQAAFDVSLKVNFDNEASGMSSVIEVESADKIGLLYEITRILSDMGLGISAAIVTTYGELAVDVFYVRDGFGHKVTRPERLKEIEKRLVEALEE